ncbi:hypothetical protein PV327_002018 [Microctonus hyperodae]|uniref:Uncharacterized protein n=1 Tax=Microctonus hyperodae TaxID=165561 RepID=A0AA39FEV4_MICHY|nr:hypothetical protein PV327_002018 [Microctonus hyperodae]
MQSVILEAQVLWGKLFDGGQIIDPYRRMQKLSKEREIQQCQHFLHHNYFAMGEFLSAIYPPKDVDIDTELRDDDEAPAGIMVGDPWIDLTDPALLNPTEITIPRQHPFLLKRTDREGYYVLEKAEKHFGIVACTTSILGQKTKLAVVAANVSKVVKYRRSCCLLLLDRAYTENDSPATSDCQNTKESHECQEEEIMDKVIRTSRNIEFVEEKEAASARHNEEPDIEWDDELSQEKTTICVSEHGAPNDEEELPSEQQAEHKIEAPILNDEQMEIMSESSAPSKKIEKIVRCRGTPGRCETSELCCTSIMHKMIVFNRK